MINDLKAMEMDRISDLPPPISHHILSHLSQIDAVKTCVLSKSWRYLWHGRPNLEFCKADFKGTVQNFVSVLEQTLIRYQNQNLWIKKFILEMPNPTDPVYGPLLEKWIRFVMRKKGVETFHLSFYKMRGSAIFDLPSEIFLSESLREIHLKGCKLSQINCSNGKVLSRHLQTLRLHYVKVEEGTFEMIMSSCPFIQELSLIDCEGLKTIKVNNHNCSLKNFELSHEDLRIEITNVSHIETIEIMGCWDWFEHHHNNLFTRLKSLYLHKVDVTAESVHSFASNFPCLEELELSGCLNFYEEYQLTSRSIKKLVIEAYGDSIMVSIDAPNMCEFKYRGFDFPSHISFTTTSNNLKSKIFAETDLTTYLDKRNDIVVSEWLQRLDDLLEVLSSGSETSVHVLVSVDSHSYHVIGTPDDSIEVVVKYLEWCLGSQLCSHYSVWLEVESMEKKLIQSSDK